MKRILILTSKTGGGHESIAQAIKEGLKEAAPDCKVFIEDGLGFIHAFLCQLSAQYFPTISEIIFNLSNNKIYARVFYLVNFLLMGKKLTKTISTVQPDLILSVHPLLTNEVIFALRQLNLKIPFAFFLSDPITFHATGLYHQADLIFVGTKEVEKSFLRNKFAPSRVTLSGWPVRKQFYIKHNLQRIRQRLGFDAKIFTIQVSGGGEGGGQLDSLIKALQTLKVPLQIIVICGRNKLFQRKLKRLKNKTRFKIRVFGFVKKIAPLYQVSHLIVGKAGPNNIFESIASERPFLATSYVSGQEKGNLWLIKNRKIGLVELKPKNAAKLIEELAKNPKKLKKLKPRIQKLKKAHENAPKIIASKITHLLKNSTRAKRR